MERNITIDNNTNVQETVENIIHEPLKGGRCICETEWYN